MKTLAPRDSLQDGFDLTDGPPVGPDGMPAPLPQASRTPPYPTLCAAGPCRHYHRLEIQVEAQDPKGVMHAVQVPDGTPRTERVTGGTLYRPLPVFHTAVHHYCYPDVGIENVLDAPVVSCNRHEPRGSGTYQSSLDYPAMVRAWETARAAEQAEADEAERLIQESLANEPKETP